MQNRAALEQEIALLLVRDDTQSFIDGVIRRGEQRIMRDRRVDTLELETSYAFTTTSNVVDVPLDFCQAISITFDSAKLPLTYVTINELEEMNARQRPWNYQRQQEWFYAILGYTNNGVGTKAIKLGPWSIDTETQGSIHYVSKPANLVNQDDTNQLLQDHEALYLYSCLVETAPIIGNDVRLATWSALYDEAAAELQKETRKSAIQRSGYRSRSDVVVV